MLILDKLILAFKSLCFICLDLMLLVIIYAIVSTFIEQIIKAIKKK